MSRLRKRAFRCGPGARPATIAIAAAGRSPRAFARRPVAFDGPVAVVWGERPIALARFVEEHASGRLGRTARRAPRADEADAA